MRCVNKEAYSPQTVGNSALVTAYQGILRSFTTEHTHNTDSDYEGQINYVQKFGQTRTTVMSDDEMSWRAFVLQPWVWRCHLPYRSLIIGRFAS